METWDLKGLGWLARTDTSELVRPLYSEGSFMDDELMKLALIEDMLSHIGNEGG